MKTKFITPGIFLLHISVLLLGFYLLHRFGFLLNYPDADNLARWDAGILKTIRDEGYFFHPEGPWNTGMFPLFPYAWKWSMLGSFGISVLNFIIMLSSFWWLIKTYRFPPALQLWLLAVPSMIFFYLPYSEAFFFLSSTMIIAGVEKDNRWLLAAGIYLAMLSRGTGLFFIPIVIALEWAQDFNFRKETLIHVARKSFLPMLAVILGLATIALIQYVQTGYPLAFLHVQTVGTGKAWHGLHFPVSTWYQAENLWADGSAAVVGLVAFFLLLFTVWGKPDENVKDKPITWNTRVVRFSMMYLAIQVFYVLFNAPVHESSGATSIMSLGRYVFCNPFWMIFALAIATRPKLGTPALVISLFVVFLAICLMGVKAYFRDHPFWAEYDDPAFVYHVCMLLLTFPLFFANRPKVANYFLIAGYLIGVFMQLVLFDTFMSGQWVG